MALFSLSDTTALRMGTETVGAGEWRGDSLLSSWLAPSAMDPPPYQQVVLGMIREPVFLEPLS